jgi:hypothetical protein
VITGWPLALCLLSLLVGVPAAGVPAAVGIDAWLQLRDERRAGIPSDTGGDTLRG